MTTVYYLLHKRYEKQGVMPSNFNITSQREMQEGQKKEKPKVNKSMIDQPRASDKEETK